MKLSEQQADFLNMVVDLVSWIQPALKASDVYVKVYSWNRTPTEQKELYRQKVTKTLKSKHIIGLAVDLQIMEDGNPVYASPMYNLMGVHWQNIGGVWGGEWKKFKDIMHFEYNELRRAEYLKRANSQAETPKEEG